MYGLEAGELAAVLAVVATAGALAGFLAGMLGVGGGIVIVPTLYWVLGEAGIDDAIRMQIAVATSLATIVPTSILSTRAHRAKGSLDEAMLKRWIAPAMAGAAIGTIFAASVDGRLLAGVFGAVALLVAVQMISFPGGKILRGGLPGAAGQNAMAFSIGGLSAIMGIGGGTLAVPTLTLFAYPIRQAVGTSAGLGLFVAIPATLGFVVAGWGRAGLPPLSLGYVSLPIAAAVLAAMLPCVGQGARLAHRISQPALRRVFGIVLALVGLRMLSALL